MCGHTSQIIKFQPLTEIIFSIKEDLIFGLFNYIERLYHWLKMEIKKIILVWSLSHVSMNFSKYYWAKNSYIRFSFYLLINQCCCFYWILNLNNISKSRSQVEVWYGFHFTIGRKSQKLSFQVYWHIVNKIPESRWCINHCCAS